MVEESATTLRRGLAVLFALGDAGASEPAGLGVVRIAELMGEDKSQISRSLKALAGSGLVERDPETRRYRLGWRLFALAAQAGDPRLLAAASPVVDELVEALGETAHLSVLRGTDVLTVLSTSPTRTLQGASWVGHTVPAYASSAGRALLLDFGLEELERLFSDTEFSRLGPNTPRGATDLFERVRAASRSGYAIVDEELEPGLVGLGAPVRDFRGGVVAALNISAPRFRLEGRLEVAGTAIAKAALSVSEELGYRPPS
ncbi:MAG TPA: IclR family transcriptional regulator [Gaiellaceae bacterium]|nr:IclR family transcriptional regulator [Gaiellaceae bacterium]